MAYQKMICFVVACCLIGSSVFGAPHPRTVVNAADNDVAAASSASAESGTVNNTPAPPTQGNNGFRKGSQLYNDIFNIPTSILGAVSRLLTNGGGSVSSAFGSIGGNGGGHAGSNTGVGAGASVSLGDGIGARIGAGNGGVVGAEAGAGTFGVGASAGIGGVQASAGSGGGGAGFGGRPSGQGFFNDIFNIPITALNAVNQLLNNNQKTSG